MMEVILILLAVFGFPFGYLLGGLNGIDEAKKINERSTKNLDESDEILNRAKEIHDETEKFCKLMGEGK